MPLPEIDYAPPADTGLDICYQDSQLLIVNKPAGLLSVPGRGEHRQDCLATRVQQAFPQALVAHRLDMETSGLMMFALSADMQRNLGRLFETRAIRKQYVAIVQGTPPQTRGEISLPLRCDWPNRPKQIVDHELGKPSLTRYQVDSCNTAEQISRLTLHPATGRTHQLRVHLYAIGHPILGDRLYGDKQSVAASPRLLLHAEALAFHHPQNDEPVHVVTHAPF